MKELDEILKNNPKLAEEDPQQVIHFEFTGTDDDPINVPLCGELSKQKTITKSLTSFRNLKGKKVPCPNCHSVLSQLEYEVVHNESFTHETAKQIAANASAGKNGKIPLPDVNRHWRWDIEKIEEIPEEELVPIEEQILGTSRETFWKNLLKHGIAVVDD